MFILPQFQFFRWKSITVSVAVPATVTYDMYFNYTSLLINAESSSTGVRNVTFIDSSSNAFAITPTGSPTQTSLTPYTPNDWGVQFDGVSRLSVPAGSNFAYGLGAFTIEAWVNPTSYNNSVIYSQTVAGTNYFVFGISASNQLYFIGTTSGGGTSIVATSGVVIPNQWSHVTLVREGSGSNQLKMYVNGILAGVGTNSTNFTDTTYAPSIGMYTHAVQLGFLGYISNLRVVKGQALYTGNFIPPVSAYTTYNVGGYGNVVPALTGTVSLLACEDNRFKDNSSSNLAITTTGSPRVGPFNPFRRFTNASYSGYFGGNGNYITGVDTTLNQGATGAWTFEAFVRPAAIDSYFYTVGTGGAYGNGFYVRYTASTKKFTWVQSNGSTNTGILNSNNTYDPSIWYHLAVSKDSNNTVRMFVNGILATSATNVTGAVSNGTRFVVNGLNDNNGLGTGGTTISVSNLHWVKGTCLYTTDFTPPTASITSVADTKLLILQDSNLLIDNSPSPKTITATGTPYATKNTPFMDTNVYPDIHSGYFNGSSSIVVTRDTSLIPAASADFTIEMWVYPTATPNATQGAQLAGFHEYQLNADWMTGIGGTDFVAGGGMYPWFVINTGPNVKITSSITTPLSTWSHIAITRSGTGSNNIKMFVNGVSAGSATSNVSLTVAGSNNLCIGADSANDECRYTGYISNVRIINGQGIYNGNFTPSIRQLENTTVGSTGSGAASAITGQVSLLALRGPNLLVDNSPSPKTITAAGSPIATRNIPFTDRNIYYPDSYGAYFNGSSMIQSSPSFPALSTNDFTVEFWFYTSSLAGVQTLFTTAVTTDKNGIYIGSDAGEIQVIFGDTVNWTYIVGTAAAPRTVLFSQIGSLNAWNHLAVTRSGASASVYINGKLYRTTSISSGLTLTNTNSAFSVGNRTVASQPYTGYISNVRVITGQVLYTGVFTPATRSLTNSTIGATGSGVAASLSGTVALLTLKNTTFVDESPSPKTITSVGTPIINDFSPFPTVSAVSSYTPVAYNPSTHGGSIYFNGSSYLTTPYLTSYYWNTSDFTIDLWVYVSQAPSSQTFLFGNSNPTGGQVNWNIVLETDMRVGFYYWTGAGRYTYSPEKMTIGSWNHVAFSHVSGSGFKVYVNGIGNPALTAIIGTPSHSGIGSLTLGAFNNTFAPSGTYVSDVRVVRGSALYTTNFTPPSAPLSVVAGTQLLLKGNNGAVYDATNKNLITVTGTASASTTVTKFGSKSLYFNGGVNDYLTVTETDQIILSSGTPFTIEGWFYPTMSNFSSRYFTIFSKRSSSSDATLSYELYTRLTTGVISFANGNGSVYESSTPIDLNAWNHIACTYDGSNIRLYKNGISILGPTAVAITNKAANLIIGNAWPGGSQQYQGYIDDFRITKGINRYAGLSSFTIPTSAFPTQ